MPELGASGTNTERSIKVKVLRGAPNVRKKVCGHRTFDSQQSHFLLYFCRFVSDLRPDLYGMDEQSSWCVIEKCGE